MDEEIAKSGSSIIDDEATKLKLWAIALYVE